MLTIAGWIERHAARTPAKPAIEHPQGSLSYRQLASRIAALVRWLEDDIGVAAGDRVAWLGHNTPDLIALLFACAHCRAIFAPLNWRLAGRELAVLAQDAHPRAIVVERGCAEFLDTFVGAGRVVTCGFTHAGLEQLPENGPYAALAQREIDADTPALLIYTSGTTGLPKGAVLTQEALLYNALSSLDMHGMTAADRILNVLPMFHVGGINIQCLPGLYCGATVILEPRFEPERALSLMTSANVSLAILVPPMMKALSELAAWPAADLHGLRCVTTGSTDVPLALIEMFHARSVPVVQVYGCTETGPTAIYQTIPEAFATAGAIGRAGLHTNVRLVDAEGADVAAGQAGRILIHGRHCASGYWDSAGAAVRPLDDPWIDTGDVAEQDADGVFWFKDRVKHVIISGGENIYPAELERILNASALLTEAAVVGRTDDRWGEVPVIVAVRADPAVRREDILRLFDDTVARYKRPREVVFVEALPRTALGKVAVAQLKELLTR